MHICLQACSWTATPPAARGGCWRVGLSTLSLSLSLSLCICIYLSLYIYIYTYTYVSLYIYIYREREIHRHISIYIYIHDMHNIMQYTMYTIVLPDICLILYSISQSRAGCRIVGRTNAFCLFRPDVGRHDHCLDCMR